MRFTVQPHPSFTLIQAQQHMRQVAYSDPWFVLSQMGGFLASIYSACKVIVYMYQRTHVIQYACDQVYLSKRFSREEKNKDFDMESG
jgi:hypothetical protein